MAVLTADTALQFSTGGWHTDFFPVAVDIIYKNAMVAINAAGFLVPATDTAGEVFVGIANEQIDNSGGSAGDLNAQVSISDGTGRVRLPGSFAQTDVAELAFVTDDNNVGTPGTDPGNSVIVGRMIRFESSTLSWIAVRAHSGSAAA